MCSVNATAANRAALITLHDYLRTMGNLKTVEGSTVAGKSNHGRKYQSERLRNSEATSVKSGNSAHHLRPRWTHKHRRFANLSVVHRNSSSTSRIILIYITGSSSSTSRRHSTILIYIAPVARRIKYATFPQRHPAEGSQLTNKLLSVGETRGPS